MYLHPSVDPSLTHFLGVFPAFGTGFGAQCCGPRGVAGVRMKQKSRFKFLSWPEFEPRTLQFDVRERYHLTTAHPLILKQNSWKNFVHLLRALKIHANQAGSDVNRTINISAANEFHNMMT